MSPALAFALVLGTDAVFLRHSASIDLTDPILFAVETSVETIIPLDAAGVSRYSVLTVPFDNSTETVSVDVAQMHPVRPGRPDVPALISERPRPGLAASGRLESNFRELVVEFPGLETGDTIFVSTRREIGRLPLADAYSYSFFMQSMDSVSSGSFTVLWPADEPFHFSGPAPSQDFSEAGIRRISWLSGAMSPLPRLPLGVALEQEAAHVTIASHTPSELGIWLFDILDPGIPGGEEAIALAGVLDSVGRDPDTLRAWVASNISFLGSGIGTDPGFSPRTPLQTLQDRCGVCRDKSVLLTALLRASGHEAWLGLMRISHPLDPLCGIRDFDHMVVLLDRGDRLDVLDASTTRHSTPAGYALRGLPVLPVALWCDGYETVPWDSCDTLRIVVSLGFTAGLDSLEGSFSASFSGAADELWRDMLARIDSPRWPELLEALFGASPGSTLEVVGDPSDPLSTIAVSGTVSLPSRLVGTDDRALILPGLAELDVVGSRLSALLLSGDGAGGRAEGSDTPLFEVLEGSLRVPDGLRPLRTIQVSGAGYSGSTRLDGDSLFWSETCDLGSHLSDVLRETAMARIAGAARRMVLEAY